MEIELVISCAISESSVHCGKLVVGFNYNQS
jgi:hypothetical protein